MQNSVYFFSNKNELVSIIVFFGGKVATTYDDAVEGVSLGDSDKIATISE